MFDLIIHFVCLACCVRVLAARRSAIPASAADDAAFGALGAPNPTGAAAIDASNAIRASAQPSADAATIAASSDARKLAIAQLHERGAVVQLRSNWLDLLSQ